MTEEFSECSLTHLLQGKEGMPIFSVTAPLMIDQSNETPLHFVEQYKDPEWHWNEWELRRRALQKANIRNRKTTGSQTENSNYRRDNEAQVYLPKPQETQTGISTSTQIEQSLTYVVGLRDKRVKQQV